MPNFDLILMLEIIILLFQLQRELVAISERDDICGIESSWNAFAPKIKQLAALEAKKSNKLQKMMTYQRSELEGKHEGKIYYPLPCLLIILHSHAVSACLYN